MICFFQSGNQRVIAVDAVSELSSEQLSRLSWLFGKVSLVKTKSVKGYFIGPRREMITPWSTNAVEIAQNMGVDGILRIEEFHEVVSSAAWPPPEHPSRKMFSRSTGAV